MPAPSNRHACVGCRSIPPISSDRPQQISASRWRGTEGSNPAPSSGESGANSTPRFGDQRPVSSLSRHLTSGTITPVVIDPPRNALKLRAATVVRSVQEFLDTEQCRYLEDLPLVHIEKIAYGDPEPFTPRPFQVAVPEGTTPPFPE